MLIAVPNCQGRVSPVFDVAARLTVVRLAGEAELERKEAVLFEKQPDGIVRSLVKIGVEVLVCGAISRELQMTLELAGIKVVPHICGEVGSVLAAYRAGKLQGGQFVMPGCCRRRKAGRRGACGCQRRVPSRPSGAQ